MIVVTGSNGDLPLATQRRVEKASLLIDRPSPSLDRIYQLCLWSAIFFAIFLRPTEQICPDSAGPFTSFDPWLCYFCYFSTAGSRSLAASRHPTLHHKANRTASWHTGPGRGLSCNGVMEEDARFDELIASFGCSNEIAPIELDAFGDRAGKLIAASSSYQPVGAVAKMNKTVRQ
jgi:hypothetical protein